MDKQLREWRKLPRYYKYNTSFLMYHKTTPSLQVCLYIVDFGSQHSDDTKKSIWNHVLLTKQKSCILPICVKWFSICQIQCVRYTCIFKRKNFPVLTLRQEPRWLKLGFQFCAGWPIFS